MKMPKKIEEDFDDSPYADDEDYEEEEEWDDDEDPDPEPPKPKANKKPIKQKKIKQSRNVRRFEAFHQPEVIGIRDVETGEILAQGFSDVGTAMALANLMEREERIESSIGSILEG